MLNAQWAVRKPPPTGRVPGVMGRIGTLCGLTIAVLSSGCLAKGTPAKAPEARLGTSVGEADVAEGAPTVSTDFDMPSEERVALGADESARGLGTGYGEMRRSRSQEVDFQRADPDQPAVLLALRYDGRAEINRRSGHAGLVQRAVPARLEAEGVAVELLDPAGRILPGVDLEGQRWVVGHEGEHYAIGIENFTDARFEVVASIDGLDVIDGQPASLHKRGYVVEGHSSVVIEGWRSSAQSVASFRFSSASDSYADRTGRPREIGVIGAAFFFETPAREGWDDRPRDRSRWDREHRRRETANPFPG